MCSSLHRLGSALQSAYRVRVNLIAQLCDDKELHSAENDIECVQRLIARHRESCALCKMNMALSEVTFARKGTPLQRVPS
jgi:hypothetical protein